MSAKEVRKGDFFLKEGEVCQHVGFLRKGLVRYYVNKDGEESTFEFTKEGEFVADYASFNSRTFSLQNIQAVEDCDFLVITHADLQSVFQEVEQGNLMGRLIIEHRFQVMVERLLAIYMHSHEERYRSFIRDYKDIAQRIPQYMIASFVGVQPPSLSRMRRRFSDDGY